MDGVTYFCDGFAFKENYWLLLLGVSGQPTFKKKHQQDVKIYFPKNSKGDLKVKRHCINIPTLGWVRIKEKGYVPLKGIVSSCTVEYKAGRYYVSVLCKEVPIKKTHKKLAEQFHSDGIGIDLGIKDFATVRNGNHFGNSNKTKSITKVEKHLRREQKALSRKYEAKKGATTEESSEKTLEQY